jgi:hypothetical protein
MAALLDRISHCARTRRIFGVRRRSAASQQYQSSAGFIINTSGFRFGLGTASRKCGWSSYVACFRIFRTAWRTRSSRAARLRDGVRGRARGYFVRGCGTHGTILTRTRTKTTPHFTDFCRAAQVLTVTFESNSKPKFSRSPRRVGSRPSAKWPQLSNEPLSAKHAPIGVGGSHQLLKVNKDIRCLIKVSQLE